MTTIRCHIAPRRVPTRPPPAPGPTRAARMLALAHHVERLVDAGDLPDYAAAARALGITRARMTQVMGLILLAPEVQERVLVGDLRVSERGLRGMHRGACWRDHGAG